MATQPNPYDQFDSLPVMPTGPVYGPPVAPKAPDVPNGYEPDPSRPGGLRPIPGGPEDPATNDTLDDHTTTFYAQQILAGAPMPAMGMGKVASQNRQKVMAKVAELAGAQGLSGADLAKQIAHYQAGKKQLGNLENQLGTTRQNEETALLNGQQFLDRSAELPGQTQFPGLNAITQWFQKNTPVPGHDDKVAMDAAYNTFINEYQKVVAGSPSGSGMLSDSARREGMSVLNGNYSMSQKKAVFDQMQTDMANRMTAMKSGINQGYDALVAQPGYSVPDTPNAIPVSGGHQQDHIFIPGVTDAGSGPHGFDGGGGGSNPPGIGNLSTDQQQAYSAFLAANPRPSGDQIGAFLTKLTGKQVTNGDDIAKAIAEGRGASSTTQDLTEQQKVADRIGQENKLGLKENPAETLLKQGATLNLSDEAAGVGNAAANIITSPFTGHFDPVGQYRVGRDVERQRIADARNALGYAAAPVEFVGGMASGSPTNALAAFGSTADAARAFAKSGAVGAGLAGFGAGEGAQQSIAGGVVGAAGGAAVGAAAPWAIGKLANRNALAAFAPDTPDVARAAQAEGVDVLRPMVQPKAQARFNALRDKSFSGPIIDAGIDKTKGQIADRVAALGNGGTPLEPQAMGEGVRGTGLRYITQTGQQFNRLYGQIRQGIGDTKIPASNLGQQLDGLISDLSETPTTNAKEIAWLKGLKQDYGKDMSIDALRGLRTSIRQQLAKGDLTFGPNEARVSSLADAAALDIGKGLQAAGKGDLAAKFGEVDAAYRDRMGFIGDTLQKLVGKRGQNLSGEQVFQNLKNMAGARGSASGITRMREQMTPEEANDMAATFAESLGKDTKGDFSPIELVKQSDPRKMPLAMRNALFGSDGAQSLENLRLVAKKLADTAGSSSSFRSPWRQAAKAFVANITRLGPLAVGGGVGAETGSIGAGVTAGATAAGVAGVRAARNVLSARAMVSPKLTQWLVNAADVSTPSQAKQAVKGLSLVISREPALAHELTPIRDFLDQRVTQLLAANPNAKDGNNEQQQ